MFPENEKNGLMLVLRTDVLQMRSTATGSLSRGERGSVSMSIFYRNFDLYAVCVVLYLGTPGGTLIIFQIIHYAHFNALHCNHC